MMTDPTTEDPAAIEQDIRRTQEDMSRTVDRIGDQLNFRNLFNALLDKADENDVDARMLVDGARRNPIALGLIAAGAIWLVSDKDSKFPTLKSDGSRKPWKSHDKDLDIHHRDYVSHMASVEMREGEDPIAYQRRRDMARANFFMLERGHDEDDRSFRQRLDDMGEKFREKRRAWSDSASRSGRTTTETGRRSLSKAQDFYGGNPLIGGLIAAAAGAALGSSIPISRQEQEQLGRVGAKARTMADEQVREKKDELVREADEKLQERERAAQPAAGSPEFSGGDTQGQREEPFMIGDRTR